jgi:hypothetical protein
MAAAPAPVPPGAAPAQHEGRRVCPPKLSVRRTWSPRRAPCGPDRSWRDRFPPALPAIHPRAERAPRSAASSLATRRRVGHRVVWHDGEENAKLSHGSGLRQGPGATSCRFPGCRLRCWRLGHPPLPPDA